MRFVLLLVAFLGVVHAATVQILPNHEMNGCSPAGVVTQFGLAGPLQDWTVTLLPSTDITSFSSTSQDGNFDVPEPPEIASPDLCSGLVEPGGQYSFTPNFFINVNGINTPQTFTLSAYFACRNQGNSNPCLFAISVNRGGSPEIIPFSQGGQITPGAISTPQFAFQLQTAEFLFNPATDTISIMANIPSPNSGLMTEITMTFEAVMEGDPHLDFGFTTLDFIGSPNRVYNIISSPSLQVSLFSPFPLLFSIFKL